jgi:hypothetical protein
VCVGGGTQRPLPNLMPGTRLGGGGGAQPTAPPDAWHQTPLQRAQLTNRRGSRRVRLPLPRNQTGGSCVVVRCGYRQLHSHKQERLASSLLWELRQSATVGHAAGTAPWVRGQA